MRKTLILAAILIAAVTLAGCQSSTKTSAHALATSTVAKQQKAYAGRLLDRCLPGHSLLTPAGRTGFAACALPSGRRAAFGSCMKADALSTGLHLHGLGATAKTDAETCLVKAEAAK